MGAIGLYVHIPFCLRKCAYCDFVSYPERTAQLDAYIDAVVAEAALYRKLLCGAVVDSVFIGGGTPSLLSGAQMARLVEGLRAVRSWEMGAEVTAEANPETLNEEKLHAYRECGINRLSIGLQTHQNALLRDIGRGHTWETFLRAYEDARRHFDNINIDLIFGLPAQTEADFSESVRRVIALAPQHVSAYALKLEAATPLAARFAGVDEETDRAMYHSAARLLTGAGYTHYETSNFARAGFECRHNLKYWTGDVYLGLGVAAHSYVAGRRFSNVAGLDDYLRLVAQGQRPLSGEQVLTQNDRRIEFIMLRLRLARGIRFADYNARFGGDFATDFADAIQTARAAGLIDADAVGVRPTLKGFDLQNALIGEFIKKL